MNIDLFAQPPDLLPEDIWHDPVKGVVLCQAIRDDTGQIVDFRVIRCNEQVTALTGFTQQQILSVSMLGLDPDGIASGIFDTYRQVTQTGLPIQVEHYFEAGKLWMAQTLGRCGDGVLAVWTNINAHKQAEQAKQQEIGLLQAILDNAQTGIAVMQSVRDQEGRVVNFRFTHLNFHAERITQLPKEQLIGQLYTTAWPESRTNGVLNWHIQVAETGEPAKINGANLPVSGYDGWYNVRVRRFGDGVIATFVDVTALKETELANQRQANLLRSVLDNSSNAIIAFRSVRDPTTGDIVDFQYVAHNEVNRRNMNLTDEEILGHTLLEFFPQMVAAGLFSRFVNAVITGEPTTFEQEFTGGGWSGWFEITARKWDDGMVLTLVDITENKKRQQQIEQANRDLLNANDNLRQFAYVASHDLQEPLRKIMAFGDMLQEQFAPQLGSSGQDMIVRMQAAAGRMSELIRAVLAYSRISTHRESFKPVALGDVVRDVTLELKRDFGDIDTCLHINALPTVPGDRGQLRQLFSNLLANALKFRPDNQPVSIQITCQTILGANGPVELQPTKSYHEVCVVDNGIGFENRHVDRIFQVFQRLHTRQQYNGTGVGLAICKRVVENHYGAITASSEPGQGSIFKVYLPA